MIRSLREHSRSPHLYWVLISNILLVGTLTPGMVKGQEIRAMLEAQECFEETQKDGRPVSDCQPLTIVGEAVECFEGSLKRGKNSSDCGAGAIPIETLVSPQSGFPQSLYEDARLALKDLALSSDILRIRIGAVYLLARQGHQLNPQAIPGTVDELTALYHQSNQADVKGSIITLMPYQAEREAAIEFLAEVAAQPGIAGVHWPLPFRAAMSLSKMGTEGEAALKRLHASGTAGQRVQRYLDRIAKKGYRDLP